MAEKIEIAKMASLLGIPRETLLQIINYLPKKAPHGINGDWFSLCLVSKQMNDIMTPLVYRSISLDCRCTCEDGAWPFEALLRPNHRGIRHIKYLNIKGNGFGRLEWEERVTDSSLEDDGDTSLYVQEPIADALPMELSSLGALLTKIPAGQLSSFCMSRESYLMIPYLLESRQVNMQHLQISSEIRGTPEHHTWHGCGLLDAHLSKGKGKIRDFLQKKKDLSAEKFLQSCLRNQRNHLVSLEVSYLERTSIVLTLFGILFANRASLRHLSLIGFMKQLAWDKTIHQNILGRGLVLDDDYITSKEPLLKDLKTLTIRNKALSPGFSRFLLSIVDLEKLHKLELFRVECAHSIVGYNLDSFHNRKLSMALSEICIDHGCTVEDFDLFLSDLPAQLRSIHFVHHGGTSYPHPLHIIAQARTLRRLWLEITDSNDGHVPIMRHIEDCMCSQVLRWDNISELQNLDELCVAISDSLLRSLMVDDCDDGEIKILQRLSLLRVLNRETKHAKTYAKGMQNNVLKYNILGERIHNLCITPFVMVFGKDRCDFWEAIGGQQVFIFELLQSVMFRDFMVKPRAATIEEARYANPDLKMLDWEVVKSEWSIPATL